MLSKNKLVDLYLKKGKSMQEIASILGCSLHKVSYWMNKHEIKSRTISDAVYLKNNPAGDPFKIKTPNNLREAELFGMGLGLYWGEGTKADKVSVRLGNTDPKLIKKFIEFLVKFFEIKKEDLRFSLQLFSDIPQREAMDFWKKWLNINPSQFYKVTITKSRSAGTYKKKSPYGVIIVYYHNKRLRDIIVNMLPM